MTWEFTQAMCQEQFRTVQFLFTF